MIQKVPSLRRRASALAGGVICAIATAFPAVADDHDALAILRSMSDFIAAQQTLHATFDSDIEVLTPALEKVQFSSSGEVMLARPDKLHVRRTGGYSDAALYFDGTTATLVSMSDNRFARLGESGTLEQFRDQMRQTGGVSLPGADLLMTDAFDILSADVIEAKHIGQGVIDGKLCEHLAFRNLDTDWQLWVATGDRPAPCKLVVTSKTLTGGPQYTLRIKTFETGVELAADAFTFTPPAGATEVALTALGDIDEIPPAAAPAE